MARRLAIGSVQLSNRAPRIVAAGGEAELEALATAGGADLVELRADLCEEPRPETLPALLARLRACGRPLILTARAAAEGGRPMDEARRRALYTSGLPHADAIAVEIAPTTLATGPAGPLSRVVLPAAGSLLTYGDVGRPTAPSGQLSLAELAALLRRLLPPQSQPSGRARGARGGGGGPPS